MLRFVAKKLALLPLSLLLLSLLCFGLSRVTPGDPVDAYQNLEGRRTADEDPVAYERDYQEKARQLGRDRPAFYFSLTNAALPDTFSRIVYPGHREALRELSVHYGNWPALQDYYRALRHLSYRNVGADSKTTARARRLLLIGNPERIAASLGKMEGAEAARPVAAAFQALRANPRRNGMLVPKFLWHGTDNQYHRWLTNLLRGDLGASYQDGRAVTDKITTSLKWTALINFLAILVIFLVALPLGLFLAERRGSWTDRILTALLFLLFGLPSFWIATLVTNFFTTPTFGMDFFPSMGLGEDNLVSRAQHLFLPVMCLAYPSWAYVSLHLRRSAGVELQRAYVKTARMKGLSRLQVLWKHVFRNAAFPLITLVGNLFPALLVGSILIERIFNLPGMGQLLFNAASARDWPLIIALVLMNGLLTALGILIADLGYALADPRVRLSR